MAEPTLLQLGIDAYNAGEYYDAHEYWEDLWNGEYIPDRRFIQGLIQLTVAYFHLTNDNIQGARNLFNKCIPKLSEFPYTTRIGNQPELLQAAKAARDNAMEIENPAEFNWQLLTKIKAYE